MGMGVNTGGAHRGRRGQRGGTISEINVTPMVDVMLVLLIIFMVAAPLMTAGVPITLPSTEAKVLETDRRPISVTVTPDGRTFIGEDEVAPEALVATLDALSGGDREQRLYLRGDAATQYGRIMQVMGRLSAAGYGHIGLVTEQQAP